LLGNTQLQAPAPPSTVMPPIPIEAQWLKDHHYPLRSIVFDKDFSNLVFLKEQLAGQRIVQLGESSHGVREFNLLKVRLIKYMHKELGFNVLAFESGMLPCHW
jgi:erythromycin esterase